MPELVSVVIPTKDGAETLPQVLEALARQKAPFETEIVAVDSGSIDGSLDLLQRYGARVHRIPSNAFDHGETRNLGIRLAKGDPVVLLTQDAVPAGPDVLVDLVRAFEDPRVAGAFGRQIPRADCDVVTRRNLERWLTGRIEPALSMLERARLVEMEPMEAFKVCVFDNVCSAVRRSVWQKIPFPPSSFGEDLAWGRSVIEGGWAIAYRSDAAVIHSHRRSLRYEYGRTRVCHQRLHELFGLALVPHRKAVCRGVISNLRVDLPWVWREAPGGIEKIRQLGRAAGMALVGPLAQYHGLRDAQRVVGSSWRATNRSGAGSS